MRARLLLVNPTVDPAARSVARLLGRWTAQGRHEPTRLLAEQVPDWRSAGVGATGPAGSDGTPCDLESTLRSVRGPVYVAHAEHDVICSHAWAVRLATSPGRTLLLVPAGAHSWPYGDVERFGDLVEDLLR